MKQNTEEPDYRSMNEVQLKYELIKLEKKILDITGDPIDYKHYSPFLDWCRDDAKVETVKEMMLEMTIRTYHRTADMMRALMVMKKNDMGDT